MDMIEKIWHVLINRYDVIHTDLSHRPAAIIPALIARLFHNTKLVCELWEWFGEGGIADYRGGGIQRGISFYDRHLEKPAIRRYDGIVTITNVLREHLLKSGIKTGSIVLHGGSEITASTQASVIEARAALGLDKNYVIIGMVNVCEEDEQDNMLFLDAFERLSEKYDNLRLFITGKAGYIEKRIQSEASYSKSVIYPGWVERDIYYLYLCACDYYAMPLRNNFRNAARWPNKISDYFSVGRPVLTNPVGDIGELFEQYRFGILCEETAEAFYENSERLIREKDNLEPYCGDQRRYASEALSFTKRVEKIASYYESLLQNQQ